MLMAKSAAEYGDNDIFALAVKWGTQARMNITKRDYFDGGSDMNILEIAAFNGHRDICITAKEWFDARERIAREKNTGKGAKLYGGHSSHAKYIDALLNNALSAAARGTDSVRARDVCVLIKGWLSDENITPDLDQMLQSATESGHRDLCVLARNWAAEVSVPLNFSRMLWNAVRGGSMEMCILATEWCVEFSVPMDKYDLVCAIFDAAQCKDVVRARELCIFVREWARTESILRSLAHPCLETRNGCYLDFNQMIYGAACDPSHYEICVLARDWAEAEGVQSDFDWIFSLSEGERRSYVCHELDDGYCYYVYNPCNVIPGRTT